MSQDGDQLALDVIRRIPRQQPRVEAAAAPRDETIVRHKAYVSGHCEDLQKVRDWGRMAWPR